MPHSFESNIRAASICFALASLGTAAAVHAQTTLYVDASAPAGGNGQQWSTALRDLQDALFFADLRPNRLVPVTIKIAPGIYTPDAGTLNRDASFVLNSGVSILGGFAGRGAANPDEHDPARFVSVLSGDLLHNDSPGISTRTDNSKVVVSVRNWPGWISGVTIRGGVSAIQQTGNSQLLLSYCTITDNNSSELNNTLYFTIPAIVGLRSASVENCVFSDNHSTQIPVVSLSDSIMKWSVIAGNACVRSNGPAYLLTPLGLSGTCTLDSCLIAANVSSSYGPYSTGSAVNLFNCTIADNWAPQGAGMYSLGSSTLTNCIVSRNNSTSGSAGRQIENAGFLSLASCFLDHGSADIYPSGGIISSTGLLSGDPRFMNPAGADGDPLAWRDNDYRLASGSPCIDHADTHSSIYGYVHYDVLGHTPVDDPHTANLGSGPIPYLDLGAYEFIPNPCPADFNASGALSPQDIFDFLSAWFSLAPAADFNASGTITPQDVFDFLNAWFAGC
jgi:hypothetical protein